MSSSGDRAPSSTQVIDLFAGPGGLDVGARWLGLDTTGIEWDEGACATRRAAGLPTIEGDVRDYSPADFPDATILAGGPPCQTYTVAGGGSGRRALTDVVAMVRKMADGRSVAKTLSALEDERTGLVLEPLRWALEAVGMSQPYETIVLEQVPAVLPIWQAVGDVLERHGYATSADIVKAEEYGVPQSRRRAVLLARFGEPVRLPQATHDAFRRGSGYQPTLKALPFASLGEALSLPTPFTVVSNYGSGGDPRKRGRRTQDEPSATITGKVTRNRIEFADGSWRHLTVEEAGRLQTFPADYPWRGKDIGQQIGNAIPPRLAAHLLAAACEISVEAEDLNSFVQASWFERKRGIRELEATA